MYEIKEVDGKFRLYNTKTKSLLKPVYKRRETAVKNMEKKNCVTEINEKYQNQKPKKGKKINLPIQTAKTYGTAIIEEPKLEMKKAKEFEIKTEKAKRYGTAVIEGKDDMEELKKTGIDMWDNHYRFRALYDAIQDGMKNTSGENGMLNKMPVYISKAYRFTLPQTDTIPPSIINKLKKMYNKSKEETIKMMEDVMNKTNAYLNKSTLKRETNQLIKDKWKIDKFFRFTRNEKDNGFKSSHYTTRGFNSRLSQFKKDTTSLTKKYFQLLVEYFEKNKPETEAKAKPKAKAKAKPKAKAKAAAKPEAPKKFKMSKDVAGIVSELTDTTTLSKQKWKQLMKLYEDGVEDMDYFYGFVHLLDLTDQEFPFVDKVYKASKFDIENIPASYVNTISKIILKNKDDTRKIIINVIRAVYEAMDKTRDEEHDENIINNIQYSNYTADGFFRLIYDSDDNEFEGYYKNDNYTDNLNYLKKTMKKRRSSFWDKLVEYFEAKANALRTKALIQNI